ncbi:hypothetical protein EmuJ_000274100 [Echinococcus multilocularis]|uniref:Uncharacterized protein n=1 Tax=Echinococcus multilocularis TaxID=6211 RepID=A0A068XUP5_ECHMU|nr:hypothetical protein EmuJ_000274100 [Echinococcus multilocularis]
MESRRVHLQFNGLNAAKCDLIHKGVSTARKADGAFTNTTPIAMYTAISGCIAGGTSLLSMSTELMVLFGILISETMSMRMNILNTV